MSISTGLCVFFLAPHPAKIAIKIKGKDLFI
ncbi:hypothetical protein YPPY58_2720, partial [Yersinia pestis PY-58]